MAKKYSIKRYKPKKRKRKLAVTKTANNRSLLLFLSFLFFCFFSIYLVNNLSSFKLKKNIIFSNVIQNVDADLNDELINSDIKSYLTNYKTSVYDKTLGDKILSYINLKYPFMKNSDISFNPVTGSIKVEAEPIKSIAYMEKNTVRSYLLEDGSVASSSYNPDDNIVRVECNDECRFDSQRIDFIKKINSYKNDFQNMYISFDKNIAYINSDDVSIVWGDNELFDEKIKKVKYIINDVKSKMNVPFKIDLRYFNHGKAIVAPKGS
ncbi:MAG: hypothetical protein GX445_08085 [Elusimicrobia bacterium]|nr:hypothetical protein [Elusimicrobiota bacterium]